MLKTPEQYLSELDFAPPVQESDQSGLNASERAFVEKYMGLDALKIFSRASAPVPVPEPLPLPAKPAQLPRLLLAEPKIEIAIEVAEEKGAVSQTAARLQTLTAEPAQAEAVIQAAPAVKTAEKAAVEVPARTEPKTALAAAQAEAPKVISTAQAGESTARATAQTAAKAEASQSDKTAQQAAVRQESGAAQKNRAAAADISSAETAGLARARALAEDAVQEVKQVTLRDLFGQSSSVQMVSFFVAKQLFLLPVAGIQEVLRHMELIKVPQAPPFVAGAINLRGKVMPLIHLSALLTNEQACNYNKNSFIIIYGADNLQLGLIIDKINSMHVLDQAKVIWNVESKLGDAGDFLCAIANLDDRVCGIVAPEMITQMLLSP